MTLAQPFDEAEKARSASKRANDIRRQWVLESEWTAEEHLALQRRLKQEAAERRARAEA